MRPVYRIGVVSCVGLSADAAFRMGGVLYNLLADFRETVLPRSWFERRLRAIREFVFLVGADLIHRERKVDVRFAVPKQEHSGFVRRRTLSKGLPIAAQLEWSLTDEPASHTGDLTPRLPFLPTTDSDKFSSLKLNCGIRAK